MGRKYIIETNKDGNAIILGGNGLMYIGDPADAVNLKSLGIEKATEYIEPDLDAVRKEGYEAGYEEALEHCEEDCQAVEKAIETGRREMWDVAQKLIRTPVKGGFSSDVLRQLFGTDNLNEISEMDPSKVLEIVQTQDLDPGDEVEVMPEKRPAMLLVRGTNSHQVLFSDGTIRNVYNPVKATGRHFYELEMILSELKGGLKKKD